MPRMLRDGDGRVTQIELFDDLVYVFAVTQLSGFLVEHRSVEGAVQTAVLLAMVWQVWVYTTWMTNYLDPNQLAVRLALVALMLGSLVLSAALAWSGLAAVAIIGGAFVHGNARASLWLAGVLIELVGAAIGFATPLLGRSATSDWTIDGGHFAERCQAFVLIALGESIIVSGARLSGVFGTSHSSSARVVAFVVAFAGSVALWWCTSIGRRPTRCCSTTPRCTASSRRRG